MSQTDQPRWENFIGRPLNAWSRAELEEQAALQRKDPPKIRKVIDALDAAGVDDVAMLSEDDLARLRQELGLTKFASVDSILRSTTGRKGSPEDEG